MGRKPSGNPPAPPQPNQTPKCSQTGGGGYNPQIQGDTRVYGVGLINMGSFYGGGRMGLPVLILGLVGIVRAYFYFVARKERLKQGARFRFSGNPSGEPPEPPQPTQTTEYSQIGGGGNNPQIQGGDIRVDGGGRQIGGGGNNPQIQGGGDIRVHGGGRQIGGGGNNPQIGGGANNPQIQGNISVGGMRLRD